MLLLAIPGLQARTHFKNKDVFEATAYSQAGITASGEHTHRHIVAADPKILPLGTRVKIKWAGWYSGEYVVADTGAKIEGRRLDIYMPSTVRAKKFGIRPVNVKIVEMGKGTDASARQADQAVKVDVARDLRNNGVQAAATKEDVAIKDASTGHRTPSDAELADAENLRRTKR